MKINIQKLTNADLLRRANEFTTGHESKMSLAMAYRLGHTVIRTQLFSVECYGIPQFVAYHLRTHFTLHAMPPYEYGWMKSKRTDKGRIDFNQVCRDLAFGIRTEFIGKEDKPAKELSGEYNKWADAVEALPQHFDRMAPTNFFFTISAEGLMTLAQSRLCGMASKETREVVQTICELVEEQDPDLYQHLVPQCVYRGGICPESKCCGYIHSESGQARLRFYKALFNQKNNSK